MKKGLLRIAWVSLLLGLLLGAAAHADGLDVHFIDIDRNDGILILCDGEAAFLDSGLSRYGAQAVDYMRSVGVTHLKYYVGTHAHRDHVGGGSKIILAMNPEAVLQPHAGVSDMILRQAGSEAERQAASSANYLTVRPGESYFIGSARLDILGPLSIVKCSSGSGTENQNSLVMRLTYGGNTFLLTGDAGNAQLAQLEKSSPGLLKCDVLKNPHHNMRVTADLLAACSPSYVVFSTADRSLPTQTQINLIAGLGAQSFITSPRQNSTVIIHSDGRNITCSAANGPRSLTFRQSELTLYEGKTSSLSVSLQPAAKIKTILYTSLNENIARVDGSGAVTAVAPGSTIIRAQASNGVWAECPVTVKPVSVSLNKSALTVRQGSTFTLRASIYPSTRGVAVSFSSDDPSVARISSSGKVTGVFPGTTTVRASLANGSFAECEVTVTPIPVSSVSISPSRPKLTIGESCSLSVRISPSNATYPQVSFSSADPAVASVSANGQLTATGVGTTKITAYASNGKSRTVSVTVLPVYVTGITLSADRTTLVLGASDANHALLSASVQPLNATIPQIKWVSSNTRVVRVDENGCVTATGVGRATVYACAVDGSRRKSSLRLTVNPNQFIRSKPVIEPNALTISAKQIRINRGQLEVTLYFANQTAQPAPLPAGGVLTLILPDGQPLALSGVAPGTASVGTRRTATWTIKLPLTSCPPLEGVNLTQCDATIVS